MSISWISTTSKISHAMNFRFHMRSINHTVKSAGQSLFFPDDVQTFFFFFLLECQFDWLLLKIFLCVQWKVLIPSLWHSCEQSYCDTSSSCTLFFCLWAFLGHINWPYPGLQAAKGILHHNSPCLYTHFFYCSIFALLAWHAAALNELAKSIACLWV